MEENSEIEKEIIKSVLSRNPAKILNKKENYALYNSNYFGNKTQTWNTPEEIIKSNWKGLICIRSKKGIDRKFVIYNVNLNSGLEILKQRNIPLSQVIFNQPMPDEYLTIQGEVMRLETGLYLRYTQIKKPMNLALTEQDLTIQGLKAKFLLQKYLDAKSYENLMNLLEEFPESVIEFSTYSRGVGNLKTNTVFWEVRNY